MYKEYAYIKLSHFRWTVTLKRQSLVYGNVIQKGHLKHVQIAFPQQLSLVKDYRRLQMIQTMQSHKVYFLLKCMAKRCVE